MDVCLYMRYSSDRQTEQSIEGQNTVCTEFCNQQGYNIVARYIDRATSAFKDTDKRLEFQKMIKDSEKHPWDAVVVYKLDRFARNRYDSATYKNRLKKNGIKVISATENISENPEGVILEAVLEGMAEFYSKELSQKITRGMNESAKKCNSIGGHIALGYKIENKKLVVVESAAQIVREAFDLYAQGWTVADICTRFNNKGYRTAKGAEFNKNSFRSMFKNERYIGVYTYKDLRIEGGVPAIIDKETFETVQQRLVKNGMSPARGKAKVDYLLSGKLFCGHCGNKMVGESGTSKTGEIHNYYTCTTRKRQHTCDKKPVKKEEIEQVVVENALALINPDTIEELAEMAVKAANEEIAKNTLLPSLEAEMQEIEKGIDNLVKMVEKGIVSESIENRIRELETRRKSTHRRILEAQADMLYLEKYQVIYWLEKFVKGDINDEEFRRDVIDMLINSVTIWDDPDGGWKITTAYNLTSVKSKTLHLTKEFGLKESCSTIRESSEPLVWGRMLVVTTKHRVG